VISLSLTDFLHAASRRHNDVVLLPAIRSVFVPPCSAPAHRATHMQQLNCYVKNAKLSCIQPRSNLWPPNSPDLSPVEYETWAVMQYRDYHRQIHSVDKLKRRLTNIWCGLEQSIFDEAINQWR